MPFQAYNHMTIVNKPIHNVSDGSVAVGYEFQMQYPSYRGTFLSCIEELHVFIDGTEPDRSGVYFLLNGKQFLLDELPECFKEYWFILDFATIRVMRPGGLEPGAHTVRALIKHRIPYTGYFGQYMTMTADETRTLAVQ